MDQTTNAYAWELEGTCVSGTPDEDFDLGGRRTWTVKDGERVAVPLGEAWVVSSDTGMSHRPVLDIDFPARLVPSTTPGHFHLYLDVDLDWEDYQKLLSVMAEVGILEKGYVGAAIERGATHVRLPWVKKVEEKKVDVDPRALEQLRYDPDAILADPDAPAVHKQIAAINIRVRDHGERWTKCANCGQPYQMGGEDGWTDETVCSERCHKQFASSIMEDLR